MMNVNNPLERAFNLLRFTSAGAVPGTPCEAGIDPQRRLFIFQV
jgi:hypothetical protein